MSDTTGRLLSLLSVLQGGGTWTGPQLAERLGVTDRTVRRDVDRLRELGYPVESDIGSAGGYRFGLGGTRLPPLMLDDDEAIALAVCVRSAAAAGVAGVDEVAVRAVAKLEQLLPSRLRPKLDALTTATASLPHSGGITLDSDLLVGLSRACRERDLLALTYRDGQDRRSERRVEPVRLVSAGRRWYLAAYDLSRADWRTFRVDRVIEAAATGHRFTERDGPDPVALVQRSITTAPYRYQARIELDAPVAQVVALIPPTIGMVEPVGERRCVLRLGHDRLDPIVMELAALGVTFRVLEPPELVARVAEVAGLLAANCR